MAPPEDAAEDVTRSPFVRVLARVGFVANGFVHGLTGVIALVVAFGGSASSDQSGALKVIVSAPLGFIALWVIAIALWGLAVWYAFDGILKYGGGDAVSAAKKWGRRFGSWIRSIVYASLGVLAASVAIGSRSDGETTAESASRGVLVLPGGPLMLGAVGLAIVGIGIGFGVIGVRRGFRKQMNLPHGAVGRTVATLGLVGYLAKGIALLDVGVLLVVAAVKVDPDAAGGLDGALQALREAKLGPLAVAVIGVGLVAYGVFLALRGKYQRL
ncbi:protein of unknown function [Paramicrobacterium humi]|uniref:DUF1206 domain-containing protein n=1 Tax=Paramicrobacterium humi TaxID=640635 RepID=A0A1H4IS00_9MICO|nr:DUF1206 domain-containing protein [Microbacterium humi]SEB36625.1 protein of unknown function [Microbacterium humi]